MTSANAASLSNSRALFAAFADETRLRLLGLLCERELCVCDLCEVLDEIQPKVSRHLATLRDAGFVRVRRRGKWKFYRLTEQPSPLQARLIACVKSCLRDVDVLAADRARLGALRGDLRCT
jgi:ArsR family transcriptional regulator